VQYLLSIVFTLLFFSATLLTAIIILIFGWLPWRMRYNIARAWAWTVLHLGKWLCGMDWVVEGRENIPTAGAHVTFWKHSSSWETVAQTLVFPPQAWVLKREILWIPFVGQAAWLMKPIAINRKAGGRAVMQVVEQGVARLKQGMWVLIFPEGTRTSRGEDRKWGLSGALLATRAGCKAVPVAHNAGDLWGRRGLLKRRGTIRIVIGPAIDATGMDARDLNTQLRAWVDAKTAEISR
jgi:1-acyl-sn-glycerol-3-phosphate acyltransferase